MVTLKVLALNGNCVWLTDVLKVETLLYLGETNTPKYDSSRKISAWEVLNESIKQIKDGRLSGNISSYMTGYKNFDIAVESDFGLPTNMVFVRIYFKNSEPENWLVVQDQNYLMNDSGNNIDRI